MTNICDIVISERQLFIVLILFHSLVILTLSPYLNSEISKDIIKGPKQMTVKFN